MKLKDLPKGQFALINEKSSWANNMVVCRKPNGKLRIFDTQMMREANVVWDLDDPNNNLEINIFKRENPEIGY